MVTLTDVLFDALWLLGLAGVVATFSYMDWYRSQRKWRWRQTWQRPLLLTPLSLSLAIFGLGLALSEATARPRQPWWQIAIWSVLTLIFAWQALLYWRAGQSEGWETPLQGDIESAPRKRKRRSSSPATGSGQASEEQAEAKGGGIGAA